MISVTVLVKDGERHLEEVLTHLSPFAEVLLYDTGSTDNTLCIAQQFSNVRIVKGVFEGFGRSHNKMATLATYDWILSIDADEVVTPQLSTEILALSLEPGSVYSLPFENFYQGHRIRYCGWAGERHVRLYHRKKTAFTEATLHEGVITQGLTTVLLKACVHHHSYNSVSDFLKKMERYSTLFAQAHAGVQRSSPFKALWHGWGGFCKTYFLKRGFLDGYRGLLISLAVGQTAFYKYMKLYEINRCS